MNQEKDRNLIPGEADALTDEQMEEVSGGETAVPMYYACPYCRSVFARREELCCHMSSAHNE